MEVVVREAGPDAYESVAELTVEVYAGLLGDGLGDEYRAELRAVAHRAEHASVLVALDPSAAVVGSVTYVPPGSPYAESDGDDEAGIRMLVVAPHAQRRGIGRRLMSACLERARQQGMARVVLRTTVVMSAAQRLYERMGFRRVPERDWELGSGAVLMAYVLDL